MAAVAFDKSRQSLWPEVKALLADIPTGAKVLDLGCGNGRVLNGLATVNIEYTGIDMNADLLTKARLIYPQHTFIQADLPDYDLGQEQYDFVSSIAFLHHLVSPAERLEMLKRIQAALKPDGQLLLTVWNLWQWRYFSTFWHQWHLKSSWNDCFIRWNYDLRQPVWRYYHAFTYSELSSLTKLSGLKIISLTRQRHNYILRAYKS